MGKNNETIYRTGSGTMEKQPSPQTADFERSKAGRKNIFGKAFWRNPV